MDWRRICPSWTQVLVVAMSILSIVSAGMLLPAINGKREKYRLTQNRPLENAPPELVLATTALGGLRSLIIDYLWLRADQLRNRGSHYEIIQLYAWISQLEPRIPEVWSFTSWEMTHNISASIPVIPERWESSAEERWRWIYKGIEQLQLGISYNQNTPQLYLDLAQLIDNKLEMNSMDECQPYYQKQWFNIWDSILGKRLNLKGIADAPESVKEVRKDEQLGAILKHLEDSGIPVWGDAFLAGKVDSEKMPVIAQLIQNPTKKEILNRVHDFLRANKIRETFHMKPKVMYELVEKYGDLDWRLPSSHVLYWAEEGLKIAEKMPKLKGSVVQNTLDRYQFIGLQRNFEYGRVVKTGHRVVCIPNFTVLDSLHIVFENIQKKWELEEGRDAHRSFLHNAIVSCYMYNKRAKAQKYFEILKRKFKNPDYNNDLDTFVVLEVGKTLSWERKHVIEDYIIRKQLEAYQSMVLGIDEKYDGITRFIGMLYKKYMERHGKPELQTELDKPKSMEYFQKTAAQIFRRGMVAQYGKETWEHIEKIFPFLAKLSQE